MTKKPNCPAFYKVLQAFILPNTAIAKAGMSLVAFDYQPGGVGLNWSTTLWVPFHNFSIATYFFVMIYGFFLYLGIGLLFRYYGSVPEILFEIKKKVLRNSLNKKEIELIQKTKQLKEKSFVDSDREGQLEIEDLFKVYYDP
mmetsp:Transcript_14544/g.22588  ORF Transcript_14544/g.22588 Transcript_14544/m.22588 type:complete len:142 (+) Transcript_14544:933-1358(+)|eukprot:CAMPEP_0170487612 /NCGR_PEP_ID=MMETSP0208-20121228/6384_1 /TAXON_ID=197538 /ORGANISM="Strombidium inclinatum, Strain S3" /LENGTH=141 /DNA_ID=CAMNT_0010761945 /DNA_START=573 /DNA_END=998 /DNA_ORIENTATION=-